MIIYEAVKQEFMKDVYEDTLTDTIVKNYTDKIGGINESELRSWDNSLKYMHHVLLDPEIPDNAGVAVEFKIPYTSKRVDFLISGRDDSNQSMVIVELKQWQEAEKVEGKEAIVKTLLGRGIRETTHPSYQAWSYAALIKDYNENAQNGGLELYPCAYLHNYVKKQAGDPIVDPYYQYYIDKAPVFRKGDAALLRDFIKRYIKYGDDKENLYKIENGRIKPSKSLQDSLLSMLKGTYEFVMIDDQKVVFEAAKTLAVQAKKTSDKQVLIVKGGPGTGKSVLAINLLVELTAQEMVCQYVTKNSAPRNIYAKKLKQDFRKGHIDNLFKGSGSYIDVPKNAFDVLIVDEAHRLNEKSGMFSNLGEKQMKEIIHASKLAVFFIDEHQRVTLKDAGNIETIKKFAAEYGADVSYAVLESQFRCNGSDGYLEWLEDVLQIREKANESFMGGDYDFRIYSDPLQMKNDILTLNKRNNKARLLAGYCWDWKKEGKNSSEIHDIELPDHSFSMSWNLGNSDSWAIDEDSVHEIGCIHTSQGLEFDYVGVIIGDDMYAEDNQIKTDYTKRAKTDSSLKGIKKMARENLDRAKKEADEIIRNTYRTLLTRGQKGCFVYCTNKEMESYLRKRLAAVHTYRVNEFFEKDSLIAEKKDSYES